VVDGVGSGVVDAPEEAEAEGIDDEVDDCVDVEAARLEVESAAYWKVVRYHEGVVAPSSQK
jgi:hypothetical protein